MTIQDNPIEIILDKAKEALTLNETLKSQLSKVESEAADWRERYENLHALVMSLDGVADTGSQNGDNDTGQDHQTEFEDEDNSETILFDGYDHPDFDGCYHEIEGTTYYCVFYPPRGAGAVPDRTRRLIRAIDRDGIMSRNAMAKEFGVSWATVRNICGETE